MQHAQRMGLTTQFTEKQIYNRSKQGKLYWNVGVKAHCKFTMAEAGQIKKIQRLTKNPLQQSQGFIMFQRRPFPIFVIIKLINLRLYNARNNNQALSLSKMREGRPKFMNNQTCNQVCKEHSGFKARLEKLEDNVSKLWEKWDSVTKMVITIFVILSLNLIGVIVLLAK